MKGKLLFKVNVLLFLKKEILIVDGLRNNILFSPTKRWLIT
jgi:hypothetical protein